MFWPCHFFWKFEQSVVSKNASWHCWFIEFDFSDQNHFYSNSTIERDEGSVAQTIVEEEGVVVNQRWFGWTKRFYRPSLEACVVSFCMSAHPMLCNTLWGDLVWVVVEVERSPPHLFLYLFYSKQKETKKQRRALLATNAREPKFIQMCFFFINFIYLFHKFFFPVCSLNIFIFQHNSSKAMMKFSKYA